MTWTLRLAASLWLFLSVALAQTPSQSNAAIERRVNEIVGKMTIEQKLDYIGGHKDFYIRAMPELGLPQMKMADGPVGVRNYGPSTSYAGGIALAASWNTELAMQIGTMIAHDARARGVHFMLGPGVNIYRAPMNGRNFEYFGEDPFLASRIAVGYIQGMQSQGVSATIKHYMGNNSDFLRHDSDSVIDERTMREIYLPTFEAAVKEAHVGAIMDSYNFVNGEHATQSRFINNQVAKKDWGFDGIIMSDWVATYDAVGAANGGLDLEMPSGAFMNKEKLLPAIKAGQVSEATIDDKVRRIVRTALKFEWQNHEQTDLTWSRFSDKSTQVALQSALESMVLLKNDGNLLPLDKARTRTIAVIGPDAYPAVPVGGGSAQVKPFYATSSLIGLSRYIGSSGTVLYHRGLPTLAEMAERTNFVTAPTGGKEGLTVETFNSSDLSGAPTSTYLAKHFTPSGGRDDSGAGLDELLEYRPTSSRWAGYYLAESAGPHVVFVQWNGERSGFRMFVDDKKVLDNWDLAKALVDQVTLDLTAGTHKIVLEQYKNDRHDRLRLRVGIQPLQRIVDEEAKAIAKSADVVVLAVGFDPDTESEGSDRTFQLPPGQDQLVQEIAALNESTIVVVTAGGGVSMPWLNSVPALLHTWYPGQEGGTALAKILFGEVNPSGHLPATFEKRWEDNPVHDSYYPATGTKKIEYKEGVFVGYRGYEHNKVQPQFPFGFGMSYTTFKYANLQATPVQVSFDVTNTGKREGSAVPQVYIGDTQAAMPRPIKELKGFAKVNLKPGETRHVTIPLNERSFQYYDVNAKQWKASSGAYEVMVGSSSADIVLKSTINR
jgi:beta-glucosidase